MSNNGKEILRVYFRLRSYALAGLFTKTARERSYFLSTLALIVFLAAQCTEALHIRLLWARLSICLSVTLVSHV